MDNPWGQRALWAFMALLLLMPVSGWSQQVNSFVYHRFGDSRYPSTNISIEVFAAQLEYLHQNGYDVLSLGEVVRRLKSGEAFDSPTACLTVDDGFHSFLTGAMPLLRKYGYPATLFVSAGSVGAKGYLSWSDLRALQAEGIEIGNHTFSHSYLLDRQAGESASQRRERSRADIAKAQEHLTTQLGRAPSLFAYPYGEYSSEVVEVVKELGFEAAVAQQSGVIYAGSDLYALPRFPMGGPYATLEGFRSKVRMRPMPVEVLFPEDPVIEGGNNPPRLTVRIPESDADLSRLSCYVPGQDSCVIERDSDHPGRLYIQAGEALSPRRSKYTLTAPSRSGKGWYWFSQLWVQPTDRIAD